MRLLQPTGLGRQLQGVAKYLPIAQHGSIIITNVRRQIKRIIGVLTEPTVTGGTQGFNL
jgi:hypothetical protein